VRVAGPTVPTILAPRKNHSQGPPAGRVSDSRTNRARPWLWSCPAKPLAPVRLDGAPCGLC